MRILVAGGTGFVGQSLCDYFVKKNVEFIRTSRRPVTSHRRDTIVIDFTKTPDWGPVLQGVAVVVHLAARVHVMKETDSDPLSAFREVNVDGTARLAAAAAAAGVKRFIYLSTVKVQGEKTSPHPFQENDLPCPSDPYAISKWEAEEKLWRISKETGMEIVVLRSPLVYGPGVGGNFFRLLRMVESGVPLPLGMVHNHRSMIYLGNLSDIIYKCVRHPAAAGKTFLVSDGFALSTPALIRMIAGAMGRKVALLPVPIFLLHIAGFLTGKIKEVQRLTSSLEVNSSKLKTELGWSPRYTVQDGINETVAWFMGLKS